MKKTVIKEANDLPLVMAPADVAKVLRVSKNKVYEIVHSEGFSAFKVGKQYRVRRDRFFDWLDTKQAA